MVIKISKYLDQNKQQYYQADLIELPGTPPIGTGSSPEEAVACLFFRLFQSGWNCLREVNLDQFRVYHEVQNAKIES